MHCIAEIYQEFAVNMDIAEAGTSKQLPILQCQGKKIDQRHPYLGLRLPPRNPEDPPLRICAPEGKVLGNRGFTNKDCHTNMLLRMVVVMVAGTDMPLLI